MQLGMIGLGRMGANMARRLLKAKHDVVVYDRAGATVESMTKEGFKGASSLEDLVKKLTPPRVAWVMVPAGAPTEETVRTLAGLKTGLFRSATSAEIVNGPAGADRGQP